MNFKQITTKRISFTTLFPWCKILLMRWKIKRTLQKLNWNSASSSVSFHINFVECSNYKFNFILKVKLWYFYTSFLHSDKLDWFKYTFFAIFKVLLQESRRFHFKVYVFIFSFCYAVALSKAIKPQIAITMRASKCFLKLESSRNELYSLKFILKFFAFGISFSLLIFMCNVNCIQNVRDTLNSIIISAHMVAILIYDVMSIVKSLTIFIYSKKSIKCIS